MTEQTSYGGYSEVPPQPREDQTENDVPLVIGSRNRGPDERRPGAIPAGDTEKGVATAAAIVSLWPAITRQFALTIEQDAVRIRRQRFEERAKAEKTPTTRREKPFVPAPTIAEVTVTLFERQSRYIAEVFRRFVGKK
jgi:hypothetical protein